MNPRERRIADFAVKVTRSPDSCNSTDVQMLREVGLSDKDILCLAQIVAYYNMSNRLFEPLSAVEF